MKKQLIIAAIACAVSGAAFAATTGSHTVNLNVAPNPPTLTLDGSVITGTTNINIDNRNLYTGSTIQESMGNIAITATDYPATYDGTCELSATSANNWKLVAAGNPTQINYKIKAQAASLPFGISGLLTNFRLEYGYDTQDVNAVLVEHPLVTPLVLASGQTLKSCSFNAPMELTIGELTTRPTVTQFTTFTDTIDFVVSVI